MQPNRQCLVCGADYYFCACQADDKRFSWKMNCDTADHFQILLIALDLRDGVIDEKEAKKRLSALKFRKSDLSWVIPTTRVILERAFEVRKENVKEGE